MLLGLLEPIELTHPVTGSKIYLQSTSHTSAYYGQKTYNYIKERNPDLVILELDEERYLQAFKRKQQWLQDLQSLSLIHPLSKYFSSHVEILKLLYSSQFDKKVAQLTNEGAATIEGGVYGGEVLLAIKAAQECNSQIVLADRPKTITDFRLRAKILFEAKMVQENKQYHEQQQQLLIQQDKEKYLQYSSKSFQRNKYQYAEYLKHIGASSLLSQCNLLSYDVQQHEVPIAQYVVNTNDIMELIQLAWFRARQNLKRLSQEIYLAMTTTQNTWLAKNVHPVFYVLNDNKHSDIFYEGVGMEDVTQLRQALKRIVKQGSVENGKIRPEDLTTVQRYIKTVERTKDQKRNNFYQVLARVFNLKNSHAHHQHQTPLQSKATQMQTSLGVISQNDQSHKITYQEQIAIKQKLGFHIQHEFQQQASWNVLGLQKSGLGQKPRNQDRKQTQQKQDLDQQFAQSRAFRNMEKVLSRERAWLVGHDHTSQDTANIASHVNVEGTRRYGLFEKIWNRVCAKFRYYSYFYDGKQYIQSKSNMNKRNVYNEEDLELRSWVSFLGNSVFREKQKIEKKLPPLTRVPTESDIKAHITNKRMEELYYETVIAERDVVLVKELYKQGMKAQDQKIVAVVGANHVPGIMQLWNLMDDPFIEQYWKELYSFIPQDCQQQQQYQYQQQQHQQLQHQQMVQRQQQQQQNLQQQQQQQEQQASCQQSSQKHHLNKLQSQQQQLREADQLYKNLNPYTQSQDKSTSQETYSQNYINIRTVDNIAQVMELGVLGSVACSSYLIGRKLEGYAKFNCQSLPILHQSLQQQNDTFLTRSNNTKKFFKNTLRLGVRFMPLGVFAFAMFSPLTTQVYHAALCATFLENMARANDLISTQQNLKQI